MYAQCIAIALCNSYTMGCPPVCGDNPRAKLFDYLAYRWTFYTTYISVDLAHHEILRAKVGKSGIKLCMV